jgi:hypothetical protein
MWPDAAVRLLPQATLKQGTGGSVFEAHDAAVCGQEDNAKVGAGEEGAGVEAGHATREGRAAVLGANDGGPGDVGGARELEDCDGELEDWGRIPRQRVEALRLRHLAQVTQEDGGDGRGIGSGAEAEAGWGAQAGGSGGLFMTACFLTGVEICDDETVGGKPAETEEAREVGEGVDAVGAGDAGQDDEVWKQFGREVENALGEVGAEVEAHCRGLSPGDQVAGGGVVSEGDGGEGRWPELAFRLLDEKYALVEEAEARARSWRLGRLQGALCCDSGGTRVTGEEGCGELRTPSRPLARSPSPFLSSASDTLGAMPITCDRVFWCVSGELAAERRKARDARTKAYAVLQSLASNAAGGRGLPPPPLPTDGEQDVPWDTTAVADCSPPSPSTTAAAADIAAAGSPAPAAESAAGDSASSQAPSAPSQGARASASPLCHCPLPPTPLQPVICFELMGEDDAEAGAGCDEPGAVPLQSCPGAALGAGTAAADDEQGAPSCAQPDAHGEGCAQPDAHGEGRGVGCDEVCAEDSEWHVCEGMLGACSPPPPFPPTPPPLGIADRRLETQALLRRLLQPLPGEGACGLSPSLVSVRTDDDDGEDEDDEDVDDSLSSPCGGR